MSRLNLMRLAIVAGAFVLSWMLRTVTVPLLAAYLLMLICLPWRQRMKRKLGGTFASVLSMLFLLAGPMVLFLPAFAEADTLAAMLPDQDKAGAWTERYIMPLLDFAEGEEEARRTGTEQPPVADGEEQSATSLREFFGKIQESETLKGFGGYIASFLASIGGTLVAFLGGTFGILSAVFLLPIFLFYLLEGAPWLPRIRAELPKSWWQSFDRTLPKIQNLLRVYCRARLLVALIKGAIAWVILLLFGVPAAYTLGLMVAVFSLLPVIGALVSTCAMLIICLVTYGWLGVVLAIVVYAVTEVVEGYVLLPRLVGRELGMSDFLVILAVLGGGALMGFFGLLIAIPAVAIGMVLYGEFLRPLMKDPEEGGSAESNKDSDADAASAS
ncbi:MAG: AI-2E family transporter [Planctomycetes bacterium]|nr:AI-2E family transporter [Planctomycetota bacterium]